MTEVENETVVTAGDNVELTEQEQAARRVQDELNAKLNELGNQASAIARAAGRVLEQADGFFANLAELCIQARAVIGKKKDDTPVHDWDGRTPAYQKWYGDFIEGALAEHAPVEVFTIPSPTEGGEAQEIAVTDSDWVRTAKRSIQYHVQTKIGEYLRQNGFEHEAVILGLDLRTPAEKAREARLKSRTSGPVQGQNGEDGVPAPTKQLEQLIQDNGSFELKSAWVVDILDDLSKTMTLDAMASMEPAESKRVQSHVARAQGILESLVTRFESAEMVAKEQVKTA